MADRLKNATSPYLLQHAGNPVDWWPWCDEAFAEARARDVPVLLSVGYAACHWCHVMAHESFEDEQTASLLNENFVAIKVDREERPDVDAVYMTATQAMTGHGGWPMTVFMTPGREPFYTGTYFPRDYFQRLLLGVAKAWREDRGSVEGQASRIAAALAEQAGPRSAGTPPADLAAVSDQAVTSLRASYDNLQGGFGQAPKFPPSMVLEFLLRRSERPGESGGGASRGDAHGGGTHGRDTSRGDTPSGEAGDGVTNSSGRAGGGDTGGGQAGRGDAPGGSAGNKEAGGGDASGSGLAGQALAMAAHTAGAMARGGMYDQLGGGFARYSVDAGWVVPHFEKMLYDNALLARVYAHLWRRTDDPLARRVAQETCAWMIRDLRTPEGGFASALDADSEGEEGRFYTWTPAEIQSALGPEDAAWAVRAFGVTSEGTFEHGSSVLQRRSDPDDADRLTRVRGRLFGVREGRVRPSRDDKVVTAWNGLAIAALAECGLLLEEPVFVRAAAEAASLLAEVHVRDGRLVRTSRAGAAGPSAGVLEDYANLAEALVVLSGVTGQVSWVTLAGQLLDTALDRFADGAGGFYDTADDGEPLLYRPADPADGPTPSGTFAVAGALLGYAALTGSATHRDAAVAALGVLTSIASRYPRAAGAGLAVAEALLGGPAEIAVVGPPGDPRTTVLHRTALLAAPPGAVVALGDGSAVGPAAAPSAHGRPDAMQAPDAGLPLLAGRGLVDGSPAAYVCRNFTCRTPVTDALDLRAALSYPVREPAG